ncbi:hypothetical protein [Shewanella marina]|uniref:hypothetical protein n=1 Tax=Shewanella marina TaxID=487319 RepID=UPI0004722929|nr:hypothetical protein [Shewanella marina]
MPEISYKQYTLAELFEAKAGIDAQTYPENYQLLITEIDLRQQQSTEDVSPTCSEYQLTTISRRILILLTLGGSFAGLTISVGQLWHISGLLSLILLLMFIGLYGYGCYIALKLSEQVTFYNLRELAYFWGLQIPIVMSPVVGYQFASGIFANIWYQVGDGFNWYVSIGSAFKYSVLQFSESWVIGVNFAAIIITSYISWQIYINQQRLQQVNDETNNKTMDKDQLCD